MEVKGLTLKKNPVFFLRAGGDFTQATHEVTFLYSLLICINVQATKFLILPSQSIISISSPVQPTPNVG